MAVADFALVALGSNKGAFPVLDHTRCSPVRWILLEQLGVHAVAQVARAVVALAGARISCLPHRAANEQPAPILGGPHVPFALVLLVIFFKWARCHLQLQKLEQGLRIWTKYHSYQSTERCMGQRMYQASHILLKSERPHAERAEERSHTTFGSPQSYQCLLDHGMSRITLLHRVLHRRHQLWAFEVNLVVLERLQLRAHARADQRG